MTPAGKGHPVLYPPDRSKPPLRVPTTPSRNPRAWQNWLAEVRRRGGHWPPDVRKVHDDDKGQDDDNREKGV